jgi:hypothetical protein
VTDTAHDRSRCGEIAAQPGLENRPRFSNLGDRCTSTGGGRSSRTGCPWKRTVARHDVHNRHGAPPSARGRDGVVRAGEYAFCAARTDTSQRTTRQSRNSCAGARSNHHLDRLRHDESGNKGGKYSVRTKPTQRLGGDRTRRPAGSGCQLTRVGPRSESIRRAETYKLMMPIREAEARRTYDRRMRPSTSRPTGSRSMHRRACVERYAWSFSLAPKRSTAR